MFTSYLKVGWRNLLHNKAYSLINVSGLAMGMTIAMFIWPVPAVILLQVFISRH